MNIIKISFLVRKPQNLWTYKEARNSDFWQDLTDALENKVAPAKPFRKSVGSMQTHFYLLHDGDTETVKTTAKKIIDSMFDGEEEKSSVIISVVTPSADELIKLKEESGDKLGEELVKALNSIPEEENTEKELSEAVKPTKEADKSTVSDPVTKEEDDQPPQPEKATTMAERARKIKELKEGLLTKIKGQRHAVDEMVQSIFECEMFSSLNPNRKGPLATFLFTGPSGVGKTMLAEQCGKLLGRPMLIVDMSEYSDNLANVKFNGDHGNSAVVTGFVRKHPDGIILFDEVEKAHINTIHLFLQILDAARLMDHQIKKEVSFRDNIIIMTTNAGKQLYDDPTVCDLSATPRSVILDALRTDKNSQTGEPYFPECITTRMANGHVILFNHLEPFSLMEIVRDEIELQIGLFEESSGIKVEYDSRILSALIMYNGGGVSDARTLRGLAKNTIVKELQEIVMQVYSRDPCAVDQLKNITLHINTDSANDTEDLFESRDSMQVVILSDTLKESSLAAACSNAHFDTVNGEDTFKRRIRGVADYVLIDPMCGIDSSERDPNDIEDIDSLGMRMFDYMREYYPEIPVYMIDSCKDREYSFDTLMARGAKGVIKADGQNDSELAEALKTLSFNALINNGVYSLGRSGKYLSFNCAQYIIDDSCAVVSFERLKLKSAPVAGDGSLMAKKGDNNNIGFKDIIGCRAAKSALEDYCKALDNPREVALSGKRMPKGILLYGPPGTGKTRLAKAMANECKATFFPVSATSFFGSLVGETERNIRDIFKKARKYAPSIIFVDEVDAIGRKRMGSTSTAHNEDALNTFLAEMDGFVTDEKRPVFIIAATNYEIEGDGARVLDPAFVRRFSAKILMSLPDTDDRYEFLSYHLGKHSICFGEDHEAVLRNMAKRTGGMSIADLEMMNDQYIRAIGDGKPDGAKYMDNLDEFRYGEINKLNPDKLRQTACHEAGHALVCRLCGTTPSFLTVISRGGYGGFMESAGENSDGTYTYEQLMAIVCRCLAGRIAELELYGDTLGMNTGASSDISKARYFVKSALKDYAMGERLFIGWTPDEAEALLRSQYERTRQMIVDNKQILIELTDLLTDKKSLDQTRMEEFFTNKGI